MLYREAGQYKTNYAADMAVFPMLQDRIGIAVILLVAFVVVPADRQRLPAQRGDDPVPGLLARRDRAQHPHRLYRAALARHRRLHGGRRLCLLQAHDDLPGREHHRLDRRLGLLLGRGRRAVRPAVAAHQGLLSRGRDARGAVLPAMVLHPRALALQLQRLGRDRGAAAHAVRHSDHRADRDAADALSRRADASSS